jgi:hypothetical protein
VLASLTVGSILLGLTALTIVLTLIAGAWLRECHDDLLEQDFSAVVDFMLRHYLRRRGSGHSHGVLPGPVALTLLVRIMTASAFPMLTSIPLVFVVAGGGPADAMAAVGVMIVVELALAGVTLALFLRGMRCSGHPERWSKLRRISFPADLDPPDRYRAVLNLYWSSRIPVGVAIGLAQVAVVTLALIVIASQDLTSIKTVDIGSLNSVVWIPVALALPVAPVLIGRVARRRMASASAIFEILRVLDLQERRSIILTPVRDPLWRERDALGEIVGLLRETARQLDARQRRGMSPHPISDLLRASADNLDRFLGSDRSLAYGIPDDIRQLLILVFKVLVGPAKEKTYAELSACVSEVGRDGASIGRPVARKERVAAAGYRVLNVLDQTSRVAPIVFWLVLVAALLIDGQTSIDELVSILK